MDISEILAAELAKGETQRHLSERIGIPLRTIEDWLHGRTHPNALTVEAVIERIEKTKK